MPSDAEIQDLIDKQRLREVLLRYCRAVDRLDIDLLRSVFHPDAVHVYQGRTPTPVIELFETLPATMRAYASFTHSISNCYFRVEGDYAEGETYVHSTHMARVTTHIESEWLVPYVVSGRYLDRFERRDGEWRIAYRTYATDWANVPGRLEQHGQEGRMDRSDPSYVAVPLLAGVGQPG